MNKSPPGRKASAELFLVTGKPDKQSRELQLQCRHTGMQGFLLVAGQHKVIGARLYRDIFDKGEYPGTHLHHFTDKSLVRHTGNIRTGNRNRTPEKYAILLQEDA